MSCSARTSLSTASIPQTDSYSFTSDRTWINHEWLAECAMYLAFAVGGGPGLVVLKMLVVLATLALVWSELRRQQVDSATRDLLIALDRCRHVPSSQPCASADLFDRGVRDPALDPRRGWVASPPAADSSPLCRLGQLSRRLDRRRRCARDVGRCCRGRRARLARRDECVLFLWAPWRSIGTLANPYGWRMWQFLTTTVGFGRAEITDWQPLYRLGAGYVALWAVLALVALVGAIHRLALRGRGNCVVSLLSRAWARVVSGQQPGGVFRDCCGVAARPESSRRAECVAWCIYVRAGIHQSDSQRRRQSPLRRRSSSAGLSFRQAT